MLKRLTALWHDVAGNPAIEMALLAAPLILLMVGVADYGTATFRKMQVQHAAQAGAEYALKSGFNATAIGNAVTNATSYSGVSATPAPAQSCGCASGTTITSATCGSTCAGGAVAGNYVTVSTQATYTTLIPYPHIANSFALTSSATVRIQ
jgi:Flp pilus assembly protein TadG